jgi:hypothetical protein
MWPRPVLAAGTRLAVPFEHIHTLYYYYSSISIKKREKKNSGILKRGLFIVEYHALIEL